MYVRVSALGRLGFEWLVVSGIVDSPYVDQYEGHILLILLPGLRRLPCIIRVKGSGYMYSP